MGKARRYYLIGKDYCSDDFSIIKFNDMIGFDLYELDSITTKFSCREDLVNYLYKKGLINTYDTDLFIASYNNRNNLEKFEVLYDSNKMTSDDIKKISKLKVDNSLTRFDTEGIIKKFQKVYFNDLDYRNIVNFGYTDINKWFLDMFDPITGKIINNKELYGREKNFIFTHYNLLRNIIESFNLYNRLLLQHEDYSSGENDIFEDVIDIYNNIKLKREEIEDALEFKLKIEDTRNNSRQLSMFENTNLFSDKEINYNDNDVDLLYGIRNDVEEDDLLKLEFIQDTINKLPSKVITSECDLHRFNPNMFIYYSTSFDKEFLNTNFDDKYLELLDLYILTNSKLNNDILTDYDRDILLQRLNIINKDIVDYLNNNKTVLNNAFNWCRVYNRNEEYNNKLKESKGAYYDRESFDERKVLYK